MKYAGYESLELLLKCESKKTFRDKCLAAGLIPHRVATQLIQHFNEANMIPGWLVKAHWESKSKSKSEGAKKREAKKKLTIDNRT